jgi:hypothetical protein
MTNIEQYVVNAIHEYDSKGEDHRWLNEDDYGDLALHIAEDLGQLIVAAKHLLALHNSGETYRVSLHDWLTATRALSEQLKKFEV